MSTSQPVMIDGKRVGKLKASGILFKETWKYLKADSELLLVPVIAGFLNLVLLGALIVLFVVGTGWDSASFEDSNQQMTVLEWVLLFAAYVVCAFSVAIAQATISHTVYVRAHGGDSSLGQAIKIAFSHWPSLLVWSAITSTVGVLLRMVVERSHLLGSIIAAILGSAWSVLTFFVVPAMVIDKKTAFASISKSAQVFKSTWGETIVSNVSLRLAFLVAHALVFLAMFLLALVLEEAVFVFTIIGIYLIWLMGAVLVQSAMEGILRTLLYIYASESTYPKNFNAELLGQMLVRSNTAKLNAVPTSTTPLV